MDDKEFLENKRTEENLAALEDIFKTTESSSDDYSNPIDDRKSLFENKNEVESLFEDNDPLGKTSEISGVDLEELKRYSKMLHEANGDTEEKTNENSGQSNGKQKVLRNSKIRFSEAPVNNEDVTQILSAFVSCSILALVTATMGVGWLLYILTHV